MEHVKALIEALPGVEFVHIVCNKTYITDKKTGLPPESFKVYVLGGKKKAIADIIWWNKPMGVRSQGNTQVRVKDDLGHKYVISFERLL